MRSRDAYDSHMDWFGALLVRFLINAAAIFVAERLIPGFDVEGWTSLFGLAIVFGIVNAFIRPLLSFVTCLLQIVTLGLFTLILNAAMLALSVWIGNFLGLEVRIDGIVAALLSALLITVVSFVLSEVVGGPKSVRA
jgi:putative membrane protein